MKTATMSIGIITFQTAINCQYFRNSIPTYNRTIADNALSMFHGSLIHPENIKPNRPATKMPAIGNRSFITQ